jgi:glycosyltransferase involved in cell wall biosynthesis
LRFEFQTFDQLTPWLEENQPDPEETLLVAWTPRENVRNFTRRFLQTVPCRYLVHLEDNEKLITAVNHGSTFEELASRSTEELDRLIGPEARLSHPHHFPRFIAGAAGITALIDTLGEFAPAGLPTFVFWPGYNPDFFSQRPVDHPRRRALGIADDELVLAYTGNAHTANRQEVLSLYLATRLLNRLGVKTRLIRAGEDYARILSAELAEINPHIVELGKVPHSDVAGILAMADVLVQPGRADPFNDYRFPSKVPEFFALGRPVIIPAANLGRFVRHDVDCLVLTRGDALEIADLVFALAHDPARRQRLAEGAARFAQEHFQWSKQAADYLAFVRGLAPVKSVHSPI